MGRKNYLLEKQGLNHENYEAPPCSELKKMLRQQHSFQWSKKDELIILDNLFQFSSQNNYANYYTTQFYNYVNKMLTIQLSENQVSYMIYCLRKQYLEQCEQPKEEERNLDSHDLKVFELSRKIWEVDTNNEGRPKTKVLRDNYENYLQDYVEKLGFEVDCLTASVVEEIKKDWEDFQFVQNEFRMMQKRFSLQLCELKINMHNTQLEVGHTFRRKKVPHLNL